MNQRTYFLPIFLISICFVFFLIFHAGKSEGVSAGAVVVVKNEAIGIITDGSAHFSVVQLMSGKQSSIPAKTSRASAIGIAKGNGNGDIIMDNVLLSSELQVNDIVVTKGSQDESGKGYPPDLV